MCTMHQTLTGLGQDWVSSLLDVCLLNASEILGKQLTPRRVFPPLHIGQGAFADPESCAGHPHVPSVAYTHHVASG